MRRALGTIRWTLSSRRARKASGPVRLSVDASAAHIDARPRRRSRRRRPARTTGGGAQLSPVMKVPGARRWTDCWTVPEFKGDATLPPPRFVRYSSRFRCRRTRAPGLSGSSYPWTVEGRQRLSNPIPIERRHRRGPFRRPIEADGRAVSHRPRAVEPRDEASDDQRAKRGFASALGDRQLAAGVRTKAERPFHERTGVGEVHEHDVSPWPQPRARRQNAVPECDAPCGAAISVHRPSTGRSSGCSAGVACGR